MRSETRPAPTHPPPGTDRDPHRARRKPPLPKLTPAHRRCLQSQPPCQPTPGPPLAVAPPKANPTPKPGSEAGRRDRPPASSAAGTVGMPNQPARCSRPDDWDRDAPVVPAAPGRAGTGPPPRSASLPASPPLLSNAGTALRAPWMRGLRRPPPLGPPIPGPCAFRPGPGRSTKAKAPTTGRRQSPP